MRVRTNLVEVNERRICLPKSSSAVSLTSAASIAQRFFLSLTRLATALMTVFCPSGSLTVMPAEAGVLASGGKVLLSIAGVDGFGRVGSRYAMRSIQRLQRTSVHGVWLRRRLYRNPKVLGQLRPRFSVACFLVVAGWLESPLLLHHVSPLL
jgi:hypothetical protein